MRRYMIAIAGAGWRAAARVPAAVVAVALAAGCATTTGATAGGAADTGAQATPVQNTGRAVPVNPRDSLQREPSGVAGSVNTTGMSTGTTPAGLPPGTPTTTVGIGATPTTFLGDAYIVSALDVINTGEVEAGMLARQRAMLPQVREFAQHMVTDHGQLQAQDRALAARPQFVAGDSAAITRALAAQGHADYLKLQNTPAGAPFDALYISQEIDGHKKVLDVLNRAKEQARSDDVRSLVTKAITQVQAHLSTAETIQRTMTATH